MGTALAELNNELTEQINELLDDKRRNSVHRGSIRPTKYRTGQCRL